VYPPPVANSPGRHDAVAFALSGCTINTGVPNLSTT
jgi:hypothetical protein